MSALVWPIGCAQHGFCDKYLLEKTLQGLRALNHLSCYGEDGPPLPDQKDAYDVSEGDGFRGDYYQGISVVGVLKKTQLANDIVSGDKISSSNSHLFITMVSSGYKIREAHQRACEKMECRNFIVPHGVDMYLGYQDLKKKAMKTLWDLGRGTGHDMQTQRDARVFLKTEAEKTASAADADCPTCNYVITKGKGIELGKFYGIASKIESNTNLDAVKSEATKTEPTRMNVEDQRKLINTWLDDHGFTPDIVHGRCVDPRARAVSQVWQTIYCWRAGRTMEEVDVAMYLNEKLKFEAFRGTKFKKPFGTPLEMWSELVNMAGKSKVQKRKQGTGTEKTAAKKARV